MTNNRISVQVRSVYGKDVVYPACPKSVVFAQIAGTKTLTDDTLFLITQLGFEIDPVAPSIRRVA